MIPANITREHVQFALEEIDRLGVPAGRGSRKFQIRVEERYYPPKYAISLANKYANGVKLDPSLFNGGQEANSFLEQRGFIIEKRGPLGKKSSPHAETAREMKPSQKKKYHNERCPRCKQTVEDLLRVIYGGVKTNYSFSIRPSPEEFTQSPHHQALFRIFSAVRQARSNVDFVRARTLPPVDYYIPDPGFIVEFDESQHFTPLRELSLRGYPEDLETGFSVPEWRRLCDTLNKNDHDPPYRDEQRAWYDTLRDFIPTILGLRPTIRLYAEEMHWCTLDPGNPDDVRSFRTLLANKWQRADQAYSSPYVANCIPVADTILKLEYLLNAAKLRYLIDCLENELDEEAIRNFTGATCREEVMRAKILHSHFGRMFAIYLNKPVYQGGGKGNVSLGPLITGYYPADDRLFVEIYRENDRMKDYSRQTDNWFEIFCEYVMVKITIHELVVDVADNASAWGYADLIELLNYSRMSIISGKELREAVVHAFRLGINPCMEESGCERDISDLAETDYCAFMHRRDEWIDCARYAMAEIRRKMSDRRLSLVMQWEKYSLCAFDCGPVFLRKQRGLVFPRICRSLASYQDWAVEFPIHEKMLEIVENDVDILIGRYWDYFGPNNDTLEYFIGQRDLATRLHDVQRDLDWRFEQRKNETG